MNKLYIAGIGPGHEDYVLPIVRNKIKEAETIIGGKRHLNLVKDLNKKVIILESNYVEVVNYIEKNYNKEKILVLVSGDTGFYSLSSYLKRNLLDIKMEFICGINSLQYLFSKLGLTYEEAYFASLHGRELDILDKVKNNKYISLLTDKKNSPNSICKLLIDNKLNSNVYIGENLSYDDEKIHIGKAKDFINKEFNSLSVIIIEGSNL